MSKANRSRGRRIKISEKVNQAKIQSQIAAERNSFLEEDNENPEDYNLDVNALELSADGLKYKARIFQSQGDGDHPMVDVSDLSKIDPSWNENDRGCVVDKPTRIEDFAGAVLFDPNQYISKEDQEIDKVLRKFGSMSPNDRNTERFINFQVGKSLSGSKRAYDAVDEEKLRMQWRARINMAFQMQKIRGQQPAEQPDKNVVDEKDDVWENGPPVPLKRPARIDRKQPATNSSRSRISNNVSNEPEKRTERERGKKKSKRRRSPSLSRSPSHLRSRSRSRSREHELKKDTATPVPLQLQLLRQQKMKTLTRSDSAPLPFSETIQSKLPLPIQVQSIDDLRTKYNVPDGPHIKTKRSKH